MFSGAKLYHVSSFGGLLMTYKSLSSILLLLTAVVFAGCNSAESQKSPVAGRQPATGQVDTTYADGVKRVTIQELEQVRRTGDVFIVDVRNQAAFDQGHIPGSKLIPVGEVVARINEFPRDKVIVTYCS
jgi:3-mercaptopyruvate sulfurtransferase SseA